MKVLSFGVLFFKLPDDFDGGFSDALRALADYHDSVTDTPQQRIGGEHNPSCDKTAAEHAEEVWDEFWSTIHESGCRVYGIAGVTDYPDGGEGVHLDLNTGEPDQED